MRNHCKNHVYSLKIKSDLSKIALAIKTVYGEGQGSKQSVNINLKQMLDFKILCVIIRIRTLSVVETLNSKTKYITPKSYKLLDNKH